MSSVLKLNLFFMIIFLIISVFLSVQCDVGDVDRVFLSPHPSGYIYPQPPVQFDDEPTHIYLPPPIFVDETPVLPAPYPPPDDYLPPSSFPIYLPPPGNDVFPPIGAPLPPSPPSDDTVVIPALPPQYPGSYPPNQALLPPQFKIENMSCIQGFNFRVTFKMGGDVAQFPVVDDAADGCVTPITNGMFRIDLDNFNSMLKCGVRRCKSNSVPQARGGASLGGNKGAVQASENMCVVLRMPTVRGVRLPEDQMVTLVCNPQDRVVTRTRHIRLGSNKIFQNFRARSSTAYFATGGTQKELKSRISIFRKRPGGNIFDQSVQPESAIQLGEELVLRAVISDEDGWQSSHVGPVLITGLKSKKSALLVNQNGCVNSVMKSICPQQPQKVNPLSTELHFRAFLFQESPQGDEMIISVRTQGCLHSQDCIRADPCRDDTTTSRSKRELTQEFNGTSHENSRRNYIDKSTEVKNWESQLLFRVVPFLTQDNHTSTPVTNPRGQGYLYLFFIYLSVLIFLSITILIVVLSWKLCSKERRF